MGDNKQSNLRGRQEALDREPCVTHSTERFCQVSEPVEGLGQINKLFVIKYSARLDFPGLNGLDNI